MKKAVCVLVAITALLLCGFAQADKLNIPASTKEIAEEAFYGDTSLDEVVLPEGIERIGSRAFVNSGLKKINLPESLEYIAEDAFDPSPSVKMTAKAGSKAYDWAVEHGYIDVNAENFTYKRNRDGTCSVTGYTGVSCNNLIIPEISPDGDVVTKIDRFAFSNRDGIAGKLVIPNSVTSIEDFAFNNCKELTGTLQLPSNLTNIGQYAFNQCTGLTGNLLFPDSVITIGEGAFYGCSGFTGSLIIPDSVTDIERKAFNGCSGFNGNLVIGSNVEKIGDYAFYWCTGFTGDLVIPDSVTAIGTDLLYEGGAFQGCSGFSGKLILSKGLITIGNKAFWGCGFTGDLIIPDSLTSIGNYAFTGCGFTGNLILSDSLTSIGNYAFSGCKGFTGSLIFPDSLVTIGNNAFSNCSGFSGRLQISDGIKTISESAFERCSGFRGNLIIPDGVTAIGDNAFEYCSGFNGSLIISDQVETIGKYAFRECTGLTGRLKLSKRLISIGESAFALCSGLTGALELPDGLTTIGGQAFSYCKNLTGDLLIPDSVTSIGSYAFNCCTGMTGKLTLSDGLTVIEDLAFYGCGFTGRLNIPNSITQIGARSFMSCKYFSGSLLIPDSMTTIGYEAFFGCEGFDGNLIIGGNVTSIGERAFSSLININHIYCPNPSAAWDWFKQGRNYYTDEKLIEWNGMTRSYRPTITDVSFKSTTIDVGTELEFSVTTRNASFIKICVDGTAYEEYTSDENGVFSGARIITDAAEGTRVVAFIAGNDDGDSVVSADYEITVNSLGVLSQPVVSWKQDVQKGESQTVSWNQVPNADGYALYLVHSNGSIEKINLDEDSHYAEGDADKPYQYTWTQETFDETGVWSALVMAYGTGYSQSSTRCAFNVYEGYKSWYGYLQAAKADTYSDSTSTVPNGYVNDADPVVVLGESENRYYISMTLTNGGNALRWVDKQWIGETLWLDPNLELRSPEVTAVYEEGIGVIFNVSLPRGYQTIVIERALLQNDEPGEYVPLGIYAEGSFIDSDVVEGCEYRYRIYGTGASESEEQTRSESINGAAARLVSRAASQSAVRTIDIKCYNDIPAMTGTYYLDTACIRFEIDLPDDATILRLTKNGYFDVNNGVYKYKDTWSRENLTPGSHITWEDSYLGTDEKQLYTFIAYKGVSGTEKPCGKYQVTVSDERKVLLDRYESWWDYHVNRPASSYYRTQLLNIDTLPSSRLNKAYQLMHKHIGDYAQDWGLKAWFGKLYAEDGHETEEERTRNERFLAMMTMGDMLTSDEHKAQLELDSGLSKEQIAENVRDYAKNERTREYLDTSADLIIGRINALYHTAVLSFKVSKLSAGNYETGKVEEKIYEIFDLFFEVLENTIREDVEKMDTRVLVQSYRDEYSNALKVMSRKNVEYLKTVYSTEGSIYQKLFPNETPSWRKSIYLEVAQDLIEAFEKAGESDAIMDSIINERLKKETGYTCAQLESACDVEAVFNKFFTKSNMKILLDKVLEKIQKKIVLKVLEKMSRREEDWYDRVFEMLEPTLKTLMYFDDDLHFHLDLDNAKIKYVATPWGDEEALSFDTLWGCVSDSMIDKLIMPDLNLFDEAEKKVGKIKVTAEQLNIIDACADAAEDAWKLGSDIYMVGKSLHNLAEIKDNKAEYYAYAQLLIDSFSARNDILNAGNLSYIDARDQDEQSTIRTFDEMEKTRADFVLLLLIDESILINQKNMLKITKEAGWKWDGDKIGFTNERKYYPTEEQIESYLTEIREIRKDVEECPEIYLSLLNT